MRVLRVVSRKFGRTIYKHVEEDDIDNVEEPSKHTISLQFTMYGRENKPLVLEHMTEIGEPNVEVTSKQQLREACKEHNCISPILD